MSWRICLVSSWYHNAKMRTAWWRGLSQLSLHKNISVVDSNTKYLIENMSCNTETLNGWTSKGLQMVELSSPVQAQGIFIHQLRSEVSPKASVTFCERCKSISRAKVTDVTCSEGEHSDKFVTSPILQPVWNLRCGSILISPCRESRKDDGRDKKTKKQNADSVSLLRYFFSPHISQHFKFNHFWRNPVCTFAN